MEPHPSGDASWPMLTQVTRMSAPVNIVPECRPGRRPQKPTVERQVPMTRTAVYSQGRPPGRWGTHVAKSFTHKLRVRAHTHRNQVRRAAGRFRSPTVPVLVSLYVCRGCLAIPTPHSGGWLSADDFAEADLRPALRTAAWHPHTCPGVHLH